MHAARGVGLAANQIGVGRSVFVFEVDDDSGVVVNPTLVEESGQVLVEEEGCLSVVGQVFDTPRHELAVVRGFDATAPPVEVRGEGLLARCLQHETDHLNGLLYLDHLSGRDRRPSIKEAAAQGGPAVLARRVRRRSEPAAGPVEGSAARLAWRRSRRSSCRGRHVMRAAVIPEPAGSSRSSSASCPNPVRATTVSTSRPGQGDHQYHLAARGLQPLRRPVLRRPGIHRVGRLRDRQAGPAAVRQPARGLSLHDPRPPAGQRVRRCTVYDCFGAGQQVVQQTFGGRSWRGGYLDGVAAPMFRGLRCPAETSVRTCWRLVPWTVGTRPAEPTPRPGTARSTHSRAQQELVTSLGADPRWTRAELAAVHGWHRTGQVAPRAVTRRRRAGPRAGASRPR